MEAVANTLLQDVKYKTEETAWGHWRRFGYPDGRSFAEFVSHMAIFGLPLIHYTSGLCPETSRSRVARGFIAVGRMSVGVIAIGQLSLGLFALGQVSFGLLFCLAQAGAGLIAIGQVGIGGLIGIGQVGVGSLVGVGQLAAGYIAIGQVAMGYYTFAVIGIGPYVWDTNTAAPAAVEFFRGFESLVSSLRT